MHCKVTNTVNKTVQYLNKSHSILKEHGIFDRFKIDKIESIPHFTDTGEKIDFEVITYYVDGESERLWLEKTEYEESIRYPADIRDTIFFLLAMHAKKYYSENLFKLDNFPFDEKEIEILTLTGSFFIWGVFFLSEGLGKHIELYSMQLFQENDCYTLGHLIRLPRFDIGGKLPSFEITNYPCEVILKVIEPKEMLKAESNNSLIDYYTLNLTFGIGKDEEDINDERVNVLLTSLDGRVVSVDTNLRDLYFNANQYLRIVNIKEEKLVSITVESRGETTRYLGGLYSGFSMNTSRTEGTYPTLPFPNTRVSIGGQDIDLACSMAEIETALGLN